MPYTESGAIYRDPDFAHPYQGKSPLGELIKPRCGPHTSRSTTR